MGVERYEVLVVFFNSVEYETKMHVNGTMSLRAGLTGLA